MREQQFSSQLDTIRKKAKDLTEEFVDFTDGIRMIMLLQRKKDGGSNKEEKRVFETYVTYSTEEFEDKLFNLLLIQAANKNTRIYSCVNARNQKKIIREIHESLMEHYYADEICANSISKKIIKNPRHFVMQPKTKETSYFIIDVDDVDGADALGDALYEMAQLDVQEIQRYRTKNGWHVIVHPFNLALWSGVSEVKKDALLLLSY